MDANETPNTDAYLEKYGYKFGMQDYPFITQLTMIFFAISWVVVWQKSKVKVPKN